MGNTIRLLIVDDHAILREGLQAFFATRDDIELVGEAADGAQAVDLARQLRPDVILMDLVMPVKNGIEATREITSENPQARVLVLTSFGEQDSVSKALQAGASGYLEKDSTSQQLLQGIRDVHQGLGCMPSNVVARLVKEVQNAPHSDETLTEKEKETLALAARGLSNQEIAQRMGLSEWTVRTHIRNILGKLHFKNRTQATLYALQQGLTRLDKKDGAG